MRRRAHHLLLSWFAKKGRACIIILLIFFILFLVRPACESERSCSSEHCDTNSALFLERFLLTRQGSDKLRANRTNCVSMHLAIVSFGANSTRNFVVLLKSILFHRSATSLTYLHLHIVTPQSQHEVFRTIFETWHIPALETHLYDANKYESLVSWVPSTHYSGLAGLFKLALAEILPDTVDQAVVIDTDMLMLCDVRDMQHLFDAMRQANTSIAMVENQSAWYLHRSNISATASTDEQPADVPIWPAIGRGYNSGLMLLDLDRLRQLSRGGNSKFKSAYTEYWSSAAEQHLRHLQHTALGDQDVINAMLYNRPHLVYRLGCEWNVQFSRLSMSDRLCPNALTYAKIVHWNAPQKALEADRLELEQETEQVMTDTGGTQSVVRALYTTFNELDGYVLAASQFDPSCVCSSSAAQCSIKPVVRQSVRIAASRSKCGLMRAAAHQTYRTQLFYLGSPTLAAEELQVGLVTQLGFERVSRLVALAAHWDGPISAALFVRDNQLTELLRTLQDAALMKRENLALHVVFRHAHDALYPVNLLRNVALNASRTRYALLVDVDFLPPRGLYGKLVVDRTLLRDAAAGARRAYVVPAFETTEYRYEMAGSKLELLTQLERGVVRPFRAALFPRGHAPTDYARWSHSTLPYPVDWQTDFEPFVVLRMRDQHGLPLALAPRFDERFVGFGWNKISFTIELDARGFEFIVLPDAFVVHTAHALSDDVLHFRADSDYRRCLDALKRAFVRDYLSSTYGVRALKYLAALE